MVQFTKSYLKPIYYPSKIVALFPISLALDGTPKFSLVQNFITVLIAAAYAIFHLWSTQILPIDQHNFIGSLIDNYNQYVGVFIVVATVGIGILKQFKTMEMINSLNEFDRILQCHYQLKIDYTFWMKKTTILLIGTILGLSLTEKVNCLLYISDQPTYSSLCELMCIFPLYVGIMNQIQYVAFLEAFRNRFQILNEFVYKNESQWYLWFKPSDHGNPEKTIDEYRSIKKIKIIMELSANLYTGTKLLNSCFGLRYLIVTLYQFFACTTLSYDIFRKLINYEKLILASNQVDDLLSTVLWAVIFLFEIFVVALIANMTSNEANHIKDLFNNFISADRVFHNQKDGLIYQNYVRHLAYQMLHRPVRFIACGLLEINLKFFFAVVGAITTYLIILIQFDITHSEDMTLNRSHYSPS